MLSCDKLKLTRVLLPFFPQHLLQLTQAHRGILSFQLWQSVVFKFSERIFHSLLWMSVNSWTIIDTQSTNGFINISRFYTIHCYSVDILLQRCSEMCFNFLLAESNVLSLLIEFCYLSSSNFNRIGFGLRFLQLCIFLLQ